MPALSSPALEQLLGKLDGVKGGAGGKWTALCPAHDDRNSSLSIGTGNDGRLLVKCHAGCAAVAVMTAVGMSMTDLFPDRNGTAPAVHPHAYSIDRERAKPQQRGAVKRTIVAIYNYMSPTGDLLYQVCRLEPKTFRQRHRVGNAWVWGLGEITPVLYRLPEIAEAVAMDRRIFIVEGEKDADRLMELGYPATTNPMGAGKWRESHADALAGADVVILPDNDEAGRKHAQQVAESLVDRGAAVKIVALPNVPEKGDVSDWLALGGTQERLDALVESAPTWNVGDPIPQPLAPSKFRVLSVAQLKAQPPLEWLIGENHAGLFPANCMHATFGPPGAGKSFIVADLACAIASRRDDLTPLWFGNAILRGPVLYVLAEGGRGFPRRIAAWQQRYGVGDDELDLSCIVEPVNLHNAEDISHILRAADLLREPPKLVVFDTLARSMVGGDENSAQDIGLVIDRGGRIVRELGASVHFVHHAKKDSDVERGSTALRGAVDTLCLVREDDESGRVLSCEKQKDADPFDPMTFYLTPVGDSCVVSAQPPAGIRTLTPTQRAALKVLAELFHNGATSTEWLRASGIAERTFYRVRQWAVREGYVNEHTRGNSQRFTLTPSGHHAHNGVGIWVT